ncbi:MAG TPA: CHAT domain-containing protein [Waterburya sp.]
MRLKRIVLLFLLSLTAFASTLVPPNLPALLATSQVLAQTSNPKLGQNPAAKSAVSGSFVDYFAQKVQLTGHQGSVNSASFSPDGKLIVTAGTDGTARVWDSSGKQLVELRGHSASVRSANFSPDGKRIVTASFDGTARVWDLSGKQLAELTGHQGNVMSASFSPDGGRIVTASSDKAVRLWDSSGKQLVEITGHAGSVYSASFSPDGKRIVTASADKTARVWDLSGKPLAELTGHTDTVWSASFSPDGQRIVTASDDKSARVWDLSGKSLVELKGHQESVYSASFSPDGKRIVTASVDFTGLVWEVSGKLVGKLQGHEGGVNSARFSPDRKWIVSASSDGTARMWDTNTVLFTELQESQEQPNTAKFSHIDTQTITAFSARFRPDGKQIVTASGGTRVWDLSHKIVVELKQQGSYDQDANFSSDGKLILTTSLSAVHVWDTAGKLLTEIKGIQGAIFSLITSAKFSPDGKLIVTAHSDRTARVWDVSGRLISELKGHQDTVRSAIFSPDGKFIVTRTFDSVRVWNISGAMLAEFKGHVGGITDVSFSPDSKLIATAPLQWNDNVKVWNTSGKLLREFPGNEASFSPDSKLIVTASVYGTSQVWDISGNRLAEIRGRIASFSSDGKLIVTADISNGTVWVWDISGRKLAEFQGTRGKLHRVKFSPDGNRIITVSNDETVRVWYLSNKLLIQPSLSEPASWQNSELLPPQLPQTLQSLPIKPSSIPQTSLPISTPNLPPIRQAPQPLPEEPLLISNSIESASFSPNGQLILTMSPDKTAGVWDSSGKLLLELKNVLYARFSPDGKTILTQDNNGNVRVWDTSGQLHSSIKIDREVIISADWSSPDGTLFISVSRSNVRVLDISGNLLAEIKENDNRFEIYSLKFSPNSRVIITTTINNERGIARVWDISGHLIGELKDLGDIRGLTFSLNFSPDSTLILTTSVDKTAKLWDIFGKPLKEFQEAEYAFFSPNGKQILTLFRGIARIWDISGNKIAEINNVEYATFSSDSKLIVTTCNDNKVRIWDISGKQIATLQEEINSFSDRARFSPNGKLIIIDPGNWGGTPQIWDTSGKLLAKLTWATSVLFSPDSQQILTVSTGSGVAQVWNTSGQLISELRKSQGNLISASFSSDGQRIITTSASTARVWNAEGKLLVELKGHENKVNSASFSPDGQRIVTASEDKTARVWDLSGKLLAQLQAGDYNYALNGASFSPDGKLIVTIGSWDVADRTFLLWDSSGKLLAKFQGHEANINTARFGSDSKLIVTSSRDNTARVWDIFGKQLAILQGHYGSVNDASFSPDNKLIVTASSDKTARLWDISGQLLAELRGHQNEVSNASFSSDGQHIVTVSSDSVRVWKISGNFLAELKGHQGYVNTAAFSPDGRRIVTASSDGTARVWNLSGKLLATLSLSAPPSTLKVEADRLRDLKFYAPNCSAGLEPWQQALNIYREIGDSKNEAYMLEKLGNAYYCLSDYTQALASYSQASEIAKEFNYLERQVKNLSNLGSVYNSLADYNKAIQYYNDALKILEQNQNQQNQAEVLRGRGNAYNSQGNSDKAIQDYLQALAIDEADKNSYGVAENKVNLARIYQSWGDYNKALQYYKEAEEFSPIEALAGLGNTYLSLGDTAKAIELYQQSLEKARQQEDKEGEANALNNLAYALHQAGKLPEAEQHLRNAIEIWENLRIKLDDAKKVSIFEKQARTYRLLQEVLIAQNKPGEALEIAERGRARAFVELLAKRLSPNQNEQSSLTPPNIEQIKELAKTQNATLIEYSIISDNFKVQGKEQTLESELYIWVIKPTGEVTFRRSDLKPLWQKENTTLSELVTNSRQSLGVRGSLEVADRTDESQVQNKLQRLHELLIKPISELLPTQESDRVIFIPQSSLFLVPFPALQDENGKYLIEKHTLLTAPSIQVLELTQQQRQRVGARYIVPLQGNDALVVGNPTMPKVPPAVGKPPEQLPALPGAEAEVNAIAPLLHTQALTGDRATKAAILSLISKARIIHLATHGILDDIQGLNSALALAPSEGRFALTPDSPSSPLTKGRQEGNDGLLTASEILDLKLNAELVVLSACNTGRGKITGDGVIGLSRSFISAGVPSIIVSLWSVPDAPTASLMTEFYKNFQLNPDKAIALRQAMLTTLKQHPNPKDWAAFTLIGEAQ